jgi:hypothetical protein
VGVGHVLFGGGGAVMDMRDPKNLLDDILNFEHKYDEPVYDDYDDNHAEAILQNRLDHYGVAFYTACEHRHGEAARYLIENQLENIDADLVLYCAYRCDLKDHVTGLIKACKSLRPIATNQIGNAIENACEYGDLKGLLFFVKACKLTIKDYEIYVYDAAKSGHISLVKHFVDTGANLNNGGPWRRKQTRVDLEVGELLNCLIDYANTNVWNGNCYRGYDSRVDLETEISRLNDVHEYLTRTLDTHPNLFV